MKVADFRVASASAMSEADLEEAVRDACNTLGVRRIHQRISRGTQAGWVDDVLLGPGGVLFRELKAETGRVSPAQREVLDYLSRSGLDAGVWRPSDLVSGRIVTEIRGIA